MWPWAGLEEAQWAGSWVTLGSFLLVDVVAWAGPWVTLRSFLLVNVAVWAGLGEGLEAGPWRLSEVGLEEEV